MPWCEECSRFLTPTSMGEGGECPSCGRVVTAPAGAADGVLDEPAEGPEVPEAPEVPWHFKLLVLATILYLGYRAVQGVAWIVGKL